MAALVPKGSAKGFPALEVPDDAVEFWAERGYVPASGSAPAAKKAPAKKAAAKKSAK